MELVFWGCIKTGNPGDFSVLKVFRSKFKELKVSYKAKKLDSSFGVSKTFDNPPPVMIFSVFFPWRRSRKFLKNLMFKAFIEFFQNEGQLVLYDRIRSSEILCKVVVIFLINWYSINYNQLEQLRLN